MFPEARARSLPKQQCDAHIKQRKTRKLDVNALTCYQWKPKSLHDRISTPPCDIRVEQREVSATCDEALAGNQFMESKPNLVLTYLQHDHTPSIEQRKSLSSTLLIFGSRTSDCQQPKNYHLVSPQQN